MQTIKPKLSIKEQIIKLKEKRIGFQLYDEQKAEAYLQENNNFFKLTSYRKNFPKIQNGLNKGKYANLDFAYLVDLAVIDARLRIIAIEMALNIEHFAKVSLVNDISQDSSEDGYKIVDDYLTGLDDKQRRHLDKAIEDHGKSEYCGDLIKKYDGKYPIWVFVEILGFGDFIYFYKFCAHKYSNRQMINNFYLMLNVKSIRNAAAHNNCIINDFLGRDSEYATNYFLVNALSRSGNISKQVRDTQLKKMRMQQIITLLYTHKTIVTSAGVHQHIAERLNDLSKRIFRNYDYKSCEPLQRSLEFINKVIDDWFKIS